MNAPNLNFPFPEPPWPEVKSDSQPGTFTLTGPLGTTDPIAYDAPGSIVVEEALKVGLVVTPEGWRIL